jgi:acyl-CoA synthetase (NDP forming)
MKKFLEPKSLALIGAPSKTGPNAFNGVETLLRYGYKGVIYPVNPKAQEICGLKSYPSALDIPSVADLAVISVPRDLVLPMFKQCIQAGIDRVIIITQGFADADERGAELQNQISQMAKNHGVRVIGPNTLGVLNNFNGFSAAFVHFPIPEKISPISLVAQTGVIQAAFKDYSYHGWGKAIDIGNACDVDVVDALYYFGNDPETKVIALHIEGFNRPREFLEAASKISFQKPIVVLKPGRSPAGAKAALSHTGSLLGDDAVFDAVAERAGLLRVKDTTELKDALRALIRFQPMSGPNVAITTVTGAGGIMAIDTCEEVGFKLATIPQNISGLVKQNVPDWLQVNNPFDIWPIGMMRGDYAGTVLIALRELLKSPDVDGIVIITPSTSYADAPMFNISRAITEAKKDAQNLKPIAMFTYGDVHSHSPGQYEAIEGVALFPSIERAVRGLSYSYRYHKIRQRELPPGMSFSIDRAALDPILRKGRTEKCLVGADSLSILSAFGISVVKSKTAVTWEEIQAAADQLGYPLVLKVSGVKFLHKSEWGGVVSGIRSKKELRSAHARILKAVRHHEPKAEVDLFEVQEQLAGKELLVGLKRDPQFGHVILCGLGGIYTEIFKDVSYQMVPVDRATAGKMLQALKSYPLLTGARGEEPVLLDALIDSIERLSFLAREIPDLRELDINPLMVSESCCKAVDARIIW